MKAIFGIMVGISGSGKSTYAKGLAPRLTQENNLPTELVETDAIRLELTGNAEDQTQNYRVFTIAKTRVSTFLGSGKNVIIDATSLSVKDRKDWINMGKAKGADVRAYFVNTTVSQAKSQNSKRDRKVPNEVIDRQFSKLVPPTEAEGFSKVFVS